MHRRLFTAHFEEVAAKTGKDAVEVFEEAMNNIMPVLEVKAKRIGGATYQVPIEGKAGEKTGAGAPLDDPVLPQEI